MPVTLLTVPMVGAWETVAGVTLAEAAEAALDPTAFVGLDGERVRRPGGQPGGDRAGRGAWHPGGAGAAGRVRGDGVAGDGRPAVVGRVGPGDVDLRRLAVGDARHVGGRADGRCLGDGRRHQAGAEPEGRLVPAALVAITVKVYVVARRESADRATRGRRRTRTDTGAGGHGVAGDGRPAVVAGGPRHGGLGRDAVRRAADVGRGHAGRRGRDGRRGDRRSWIRRRRSTRCR